MSRLAVWAFGLAVLAALAWWGRNALQEMSERVPDPSPPPRPVVNAPYVTTPEDVVDKMLELGSIQASDVVYDLGCGDGRIVIAAAKKFGCHGIGFDIDPVRVAESLENARRANVQKLVQIEERDVFKVDLSPADVVMIYLLPKQLEELVPQLETLQAGARIVSHDFPIEGLKYDRDLVMTSTVNHREHFLYLYTAPVKKAKGKPAQPK